MSQNRKSGSAGGGKYQDMGVGNTAATPSDSSTSPMSPHSSAESSVGETAGVGSSYSASLNERYQQSNTRNLGPSNPASPSASRPLPVVSRNVRNTGRIGS